MVVSGGLATTRQQSKLFARQNIHWRRPTLTTLALAAACLALAPGRALAQNDTPGPSLYRALGSPTDWTITASVRQRFEVIDGQFRPAGPAEDQLLSYRTTVFADYHPGPWRVGAELWDVRGYLERQGSTAGPGEINAFEPVQAYAGYDLAGALGRGTTTSLTVGRFTQDIGACRFVARQRFGNVTNSFVGAKVDWTDERGDSAIGFWTMPTRTLPDTSDRVRDNAVVLDHAGTDLRFFGGSATVAGVAGGVLQVSVFGLLERDTARFRTRNRRLFTPTARLFRDPAAGRIDWDVEGAYQAGHARASTAPTDGDDRSVSAYFLHAGAGYSFVGAWSPRIAINYDLASGDHAGARSYGRFDTLFGVPIELGPTGLYKALLRANLSAPELRVEASPSSRLNGAFSYRPLWLASRTDSFSGTGVRDPAGRSGRFAGQQMEAVGHYDLVPDLLKLDAGFVYLADGRFLAAAPNARHDGDPRYGYVDFSVSF